MNSSELAKLQGMSSLIGAFEELADQMSPSEGYAVGTPIKYGRWLEDGTTRMPAYPWLGPATDETVRDGTRIAKQASSADELIRIAALDIEANARTRLEDAGTRPYPQTGTLAGSIEAVPLDD